MAKNYVIELSPIKTEREFTEIACEKCGRETKKGKESLRVLEKSILTQCFNLASIDKGDVENTMLCWDCIDQLKNIPDTKNVLEFTETDLKLFDEGFAKTAGTTKREIEKGVFVDAIKRPTMWLDECYHLFEQIRRKKTKEEYEKEHAKKE